MSNNDIRDDSGGFDVGFSSHKAFLEDGVRAV